MGNPGLYMLISLLLLRELTVWKIAIVIGATGVVGRELVTQLAAHDTFDKVISITRREINYDNSKIDNEVVNFERLELSKHLFKGDILFSSLGTTLKQAGSIEAQRKIDLEYQFLAAKLAADQGVTQCTSSATMGESGLRIKPHFPFLLIPSFSIVHPSSIQSLSFQLQSTI